MVTEDKNIEAFKGQKQPAANIDLAVSLNVSSLFAVKISYPHYDLQLQQNRWNMKINSLLLNNRLTLMNDEIEYMFYSHFSRLSILYYYNTTYHFKLLCWKGKLFRFIKRYQECAKLPVLMLAVLSIPRDNIEFIS